MPRGWDRRCGDKRDWVEYNEHLVRRGEFYLALDFIEDWDEILSTMNSGKRGRPFQYPETFVQFALVVRYAFGIPYRQEEGFLRKLSRYIPGLKAADYTTLFRRITNSPVPDIEFEKDQKVVVAVDSTGIKVTNRGEWIRDRWKVRRGWIKVHVAVNAETGHVLSVSVTDEREHDSHQFKCLLDEAEARVGKGNIEITYADGAYDTRQNFLVLNEKRIQSGIKMRSNAGTRSRGSLFRAKCAREFQLLGYDYWKVVTGYGKRWRSESTFSAVKRTFGECVRATKRDNMFREVSAKFSLYNMMLNV